jgi:hypothetical protein
VIRGAIVVGAAVVIAWLAFGIHLVDLQAKGEKTLTFARHHRISSAQLSSATRVLDRARRHNADITPLLDQGFLFADAGEPDQAAGVALYAIKQEPQNVQGWALLVLGAPNRAVAFKALDHVRELNPWLATTLGDAALAKPNL